MKPWLLLESDPKLRQQLWLILTTTGGYSVQAIAQWPEPPQHPSPPLVLCNQALLPFTTGDLELNIIAYGDGPLVKTGDGLIGYVDLSQQPLQAFAEIIRQIVGQ